MKAIRFYVFLLVQSCTVVVFCQQMDVREIKVESFPTIEGELWLRNGNQFEPEAVKFTEKGSVIDVKLSEPVSPNVEKKGRSLVFLIENHWNLYNETRYYVDVIRHVLRSQQLTPDDEIAISTFDCNRPEYGTGKKQLIFPEKLQFVKGDQVSDELNKINKNTPLSNPDNRKKAQIYTAIYTAISEFATHSTEKPRSIFIFCNDYSIVDAYKEDAIVNEANKNNISLYGFVYYKNLNRKFGIKSICERTYGQYYLASPSNSANEMGANLQQALDNYYEYTAGINVPFSFESEGQKNGESHLIEVQYRGERSLFQYVSPKPTILEWIQQNIWISAGIVGSIVILIIMVVLYLARQKQREQEKERQIRQTREELQMQNEKSESDRRAIEEEVLRMKSEQKQKEDEQERQQEIARREAKRQKLIDIMLRNGSFARISYFWNGVSNVVEIDQPVFSIGRDQGNTFSINIMTVSKRHAEIRFTEDGAYTIYDMNSSNGTSVNGVQVTEKRLFGGEHIKLGEFGFNFTK